MAIAVSGGTKSKFLEPRPEWLVFYVGTLEPIIHLLGEDLKDCHSGSTKLLVPKNTKERFTKLLSIYQSGIAKLNEQLTQIHEGIGQPNNNKAIAVEAVKMFQVAENLDRARTEAFALIKNSRGQSKLVPVKPK